VTTLLCCCSWEQSAHPLELAGFDSQKFDFSTGEKLRPADLVEAHDHLVVQNPDRSTLRLCLIQKVTAVGAECDIGNLFKTGLWLTVENDKSGGVFGRSECQMGPIRTENRREHFVIDGPGPAVQDIGPTVWQRKRRRWGHDFLATDPHEQEVAFGESIPCDMQIGSVIIDEKALTNGSFRAFFLSVSG
jgi:hypothetical protein